jgi:hypothetical protein
MIHAMMSRNPTHPISHNFSLLDNAPADLLKTVLFEVQLVLHALERVHVEGRKAAGPPVMGVKEIHLGSLDELLILLDLLQQPYKLAL